jgi:hypothetical protein
MEFKNEMKQKIKRKRERELIGLAYRNLAHPEKPPARPKTLPRARSTPSASRGPHVIPRTPANSAGRAYAVVASEWAHAVSHVLPQAPMTCGTHGPASRVVPGRLRVGPVCQVRRLREERGCVNGIPGESLHLATTSPLSGPALAGAAKLQGADSGISQGTNRCSTPLDNPGHPNQEPVSATAVVELSPPRANCRSPSICPPLSVRVHLRDPLKPSQGSPGLVFVPRALNCSSVSNWTREPHHHVVGLVLATKGWYDRSGEFACLSPFPRCSFARFRLVGHRFADSGEGATAVYAAPPLCRAGGRRWTRRRSSITRRSRLEVGYRFGGTWSVPHDLDPTR